MSAIIRLPYPEMGRPSRIRTDLAQIKHYCSNDARRRVVSEMKYQLVFMFFVPRSGSTLTANLIGKSDSRILVMPEVNLAEPLVMLGDARLRTMAPEAVARLITRDPRFVEKFGFAEDRLEELVRSHQLDGAAGLMQAIIEEYAASLGVTDIKAVLFKKGSDLHVFQQLVRVFPESRFIHLVRDIRGCCSSMLRARRPYNPTETMGRNDPVFSAGYWVRHTKKAHKYAIDWPFLEVSYESICDRPRDEVAAIKHFLGLEDSAEEGRGISISSLEGQIHANIDKSPMRERMNSWQSELSPREGYVIEHIGKDFIDTRFFRPQSLLTRFGYLSSAYAVHYLINMEYLFKKFYRYFLKNPSPAQILLKIRIKFMALTGTAR